MKRIKYLFVNVSELIIFPFLMMLELIKALWEIFTESPEEAEERERRILHDSNIFGR